MRHAIRLLVGVTAAFAALAAAAYVLAPELTLQTLIEFQRSFAGLERRELQLDDDRIVYLEGGQGPNVLLVHGFSADKDNWPRFAARLTDHYRVVAVDLPGWGESTRHDDQAYGIRAQVERLHRIVKALDLQPVHIAGNSMGGHIAGVFAATYPDEVASLALINAAGVKSPRESDFVVALNQGENWFQLDSTADVDTFLHRVFATPPFIPPAAKDRVLAQARENRAFTDRTLRELNDPAEVFLFESLLPKVKSRTLILWGDQDHFIDVSAVEVLRAGLPGSEVVIMKDCGHAPMLERPEEAGDHYRHFLESL